MNLGEMKTRAWWMIDDNEVSPTEIDATTLAGMINDAIRDLSPSLNIIKSATPTFTSGVASLPADFIMPVAVYDDTKRLAELREITDKVKDTDSCQQYFIPNNTQINVFGITPAGTIKLWYKAKETALSNDADIPANIPVQYHRYIPEVYVPALYYKKIGRMSIHSEFMNQWEQVKREVSGATKIDRLAGKNDIQDVYYDPGMYGGGNGW